MSSVSVACIAVNNKKILIAHRNPTGAMGNRWEFPGGKVEENESDEETVVREFQEEFGITVKVIEKITENSFEHNGKKRSLHAYLITVPHDGGDVKYILSEHSEYKWVCVDEIPVDNFVDSDLKILSSVKEYLKEKKLI